MTKENVNQVKNTPKTIKKTEVEETAVIKPSENRRTNVYNWAAKNRLILFAILAGLLLFALLATAYGLGKQAAISDKYDRPTQHERMMRYHNYR